MPVDNPRKLPEWEKVSITRLTRKMAPPVPAHVTTSCNQLAAPSTPQSFAIANQSCCMCNAHHTTSPRPASNILAAVVRIDMGCGWRPLSRCICHLHAQHSKARHRHAHVRAECRSLRAEAADMTKNDCNRPSRRDCHCK